MSQSDFQSTAVDIQNQAENMDLSKSDISKTQFLTQSFYFFLVARQAGRNEATNSLSESHLRVWQVLSVLVQNVPFVRHFFKKNILCRILKLSYMLPVGWEYAQLWNIFQRTPGGSFNASSAFSSLKERVVKFVKPDKYIFKC